MSEAKFEYEKYLSIKATDGDGGRISKQSVEVLLLFEILETLKQIVARMEMRDE